jgi:hypothetical protein
MISAKIARHRQTLSDQLVLGLVTGGLLGPGIFIDSRDAKSIRFNQKRGRGYGGGVRGEILISSQESGENLVECNLSVNRGDWRRFFIASGIGAVIATGVALAFGWLVPWSILAGIVGALGVDTLQVRMTRMRLQHQVEAYLHNTTYLNPM